MVRSRTSRRHAPMEGATAGGCGWIQDRIVDGEAVAEKVAARPYARDHEGLFLIYAGDRHRRSRVALGVLRWNQGMKPQAAGNNY